ncbi:GNAT family N-acetyltransferase [Mangrovicoccus algicola]|uniref:GNAT family N-acetyltransferase n=1 Tax=Mangrovicoccus algicola TaxID=2771008 RepID=A0A8J7CXD3_9RHOB|nr:GNAT family N-acetyltransferase [Mangrovicoccus algicola]MBE3638757.1 GNAT family N-acetyltransferase [Mangrovicoccus algicola]
MSWHPIRPPAATGAVPLQQHPRYGRACMQLGSRVAWYGLGPAGAPRARAQVLIRRWPLFGDFALVARGPVWTAPAGPREAAEACADLAAQLRRRCRGVILTPDPVAGTDPLEGSGLLKMVTGGVQARLDLTGSAAARMARQHGKWRNRLRRAQEAGLEITHGPLPADPDHWLLRREALQARSRGYRRLPHAFALAWRRQNGAASARVFTASYGGMPVAGMLFLLHGAAASYHIGWSGPLGRRTGAHALLLWEASTWLARRGHDWAELGALDTLSAPGLARFKLGSGARPVAVGASWMTAPGTAPVARLFGARRPPQRGDDSAPDPA